MGAAGSKQPENGPITISPAPRSLSLFYLAASPSPLQKMCQELFSSHDTEKFFSLVAAAGTELSNVAFFSFLFVWLYVHM